MPSTIHNLETTFTPEVEFQLTYSYTPGTPDTHLDPGDPPEVEITAISAKIILYRWDPTKRKMTHIFLPFPDLTPAQQEFLAGLQEIYDICLDAASQE